jgi:Pirin
MIDGIFRHQDSNGGGGLITDGDTQWMTAGGGTPLENHGQPRPWNAALFGRAPQAGATGDQRYSHGLLVALGS